MRRHEHEKCGIQCDCKTDEEAQWIEERWLGRVGVHSRSRMPGPASAVKHSRDSPQGASGIRHVSREQHEQPVDIHRRRQDAPPSNPLAPSSRPPKPVLITTDARCACSVLCRVVDPHRTEQFVVRIHAGGLQRPVPSHCATDRVSRRRTSMRAPRWWTRHESLALTWGGCGRLWRPRARTVPSTNTLSSALRMLCACTDARTAQVRRQVRTSLLTQRLCRPHTLQKLRLRDCNPNICFAEQVAHAPKGQLPCWMPAPVGKVLCHKRAVGTRHVNHPAVLAGCRLPLALRLPPQDDLQL
mmetsp:Transcript_23283/g.74969  ORF Transcript_23283/g.74969 Transcript_23283/m.74969 type:complete len:299 (+) Transcript_23283:1924-2820(+)